MLVALPLFKTALSFFLINVNIYPKPYVPLIGVVRMQTYLLNKV